MSTKITHVGFADESNWNHGRFRSLGLVTLPWEFLDTFQIEMKELLENSNVKEFKWKNLGGAREKFAAEKLCKYSIEKCIQGLLRIDVLIWDIEDGRHKIPKRDDIENLKRMYYHLFHNVLRVRWPDDAIWRLHPDEHTALEWETTKDILKSKSSEIEIENSLFTGGEFRIRLRRQFGIEEITPVDSSNFPLLQVADLFAGLAVFSRDKFQSYQQWLRSESGQKNLFNEAEELSTASRRDIERFQVLKLFDGLCKKNRLGVSLKSCKGLTTFNPGNPINFWMYKPQHSADKAPQRNDKICICQNLPNSN